MLWPYSGSRGRAFKGLSEEQSHRKAVVQGRGGLPNRMFAEGIEFTGSHQLLGLLGILFFFFNYRKYHIDIH